MGEGKRHHFSGETTDEVVAFVEKKNRSVRLIVAACALAVAVLAGLWVFGSVDYSMEHKMGMVQEAHRESASKGALFESNAPTVVNQPRRHPADAPTALARLELGEDGEVWLNNERLGVYSSHDLVLVPGDHKIKVIVGSRTMIQALPVQAGEEFILRFNLAEKRIEVMRVEP